MSNLIVRESKARLFVEIFYFSPKLAQFKAKAISTSNLCVYIYSIHATTANLQYLYCNINYRL